jgi:hypothetical protein
VSIFTDHNADALSVSAYEAATGPLVGFFESWRSSVDAQMRAASTFGIEYAMQELDWQQTRRMLDAGVTSPPQLILDLEGRGPGEDTVWERSVAQTLRNDSGYYEDFIPGRSAPYLDFARRYAGEDMGAAFEERVQAYEARIAKIREDRPDLELMSAHEMFETVQQRARAAETEYDDARRSWGGAFGGFFGGALASMHPGTDPLNFYTLAVGGAGRSAVQRILFQTGAQGAIEAVNQATGVQEERQLLGLPHGFMDAATRVGATALGAGALQGVGEAAAAGFRRFFRDTAADPAPPPAVAERERVVPERPTTALAAKEEAQTLRLLDDTRTMLDVLADQTPLSGLRTGRPRVAADLRNVTAQLDDWAGPSPSGLNPRTSNVVMPSPSRTSGMDMTQAMDARSIDARAREIDPDAMRQFDRLAERKSTYQKWLDEIDQGYDANVRETMAKIERRIAAVEARMAAAQGKNAKAKLRGELRDAKADREALLRLSGQREDAKTARVRRLVAKVDERMRDIAPLVGRAYSRARGEWAESVPVLDKVWEAYRQGRSTPDVEGPSVRPYDEVMQSLSDRAPLLQRADKVEAGETSADTAANVVKRDADEMNTALERYRESVKSMFSQLDDNKLRVEGTDYEFDLDADRIVIKTEDGTEEISIRDFLEQNKEAEDELEVVSTCSIR